MKYFLYISFNYNLLTQQEYWSILKILKYVRSVKYGLQNNDFQRYC